MTETMIIILEGVDFNIERYCIDWTWAWARVLAELRGRIDDWVMASDAGVCMNMTLYLWLGCGCG